MLRRASRVRACGKKSLSPLLNGKMRFSSSSPPGAFMDPARLWGRPGIALGRTLYPVAQMRTWL
jgi:hypothetical protein